MPHPQDQSLVQLILRYMGMGKVLVFHLEKQFAIFELFVMSAQAHGKRI
jgi:hypothetical protein